MPNTRLHVISFGSVNAGLSTVGYTLYNPVGTVYRARSTSGVVEYGTNTGIYGADIDIGVGDSVVIIWDTGGASPRYAVEESRNQLNQIQEGTDVIRLIWNTLKQQSDIFNRLIEKVNAIKTGKDYSDQFQSIIDNVDEVKKEFDGLSKGIKALDKPYPSISDIKSALTVTVEPAKVDVKIPNYTDSINSVRQSVSALSSELRSITSNVNNIKSNVKDDVAKLMVLRDELSFVREQLATIKKSIPSDVKPAIGSIINDIRSLSESVEDKHSQVSTAFINLFKKLNPAQMTVAMYTALDSVRTETEKKREIEKIKKDLGING